MTAPDLSEKTEKIERPAKFATMTTVFGGLLYVSIRERLPDLIRRTNRVYVRDGALFRDEGEALAWIKERGCAFPEGTRPKE